MGKVVTFIFGTDPVGGLERYMRAHARAALQAGFEPHLFCVGESNAVFESDFGVIHRVASPIRPFRHLMSPAHGPFVVRAVRRFLSGQSGKHLVHGFSTWGWTAVAASRSGNGNGTTVISVVSSWDTMIQETQAKLRGLDQSHGRWEHLKQRVESAWNYTILDRHERRGYRGAHKVFVNYESVRSQLVNRYGMDGTNIEKLPYAPETAFMKLAQGAMPDSVAVHKSTGAPLVVSVSRHDPRKGIPILLRALAVVRASGLPFRACLVGTGRLIEAHRRLAAELGIDDVVRIEGFVREPYEYLRYADVFVLPSLEEGSGSLSMLEAMQAGVAVVASRVDGIPEDVTDGENAILVPPGNCGDLVRAISRLLTEPALRCRLGRHGRTTFESRFSAAAMTEGLAAAYAKLGILA
jgi:glycosyltransferase involved in cell wall biosynthesis